MDKDQEIALVLDARKGDRKAMDTLVRHLEKPVYNAAYRMLGNRDEAADVAQTTFLKVFENIERFDTNRRLFSWTYRIAINEAIDQLKRLKRSEPLDESAPSNEPSPQDSTAALQLSDEVQATLMDLHEDHRAVIVLRYFSECSYQDIGMILQLPEKTVKSRLFSARQQMKTRLQQHGVTSS
ncbi:MAG: sigma-70 family RNA polymerase sigma factor [Desulfobulbaceae bacterium]|nr:sigma-70 family RNA polymerase sigma factor [Desulfobulbaceae bacterium]